MHTEGSCLGLLLYMNEASHQREEDLALLAREIVLSARRDRVEKKKKQSSYCFFSSKTQETESEESEAEKSPVVETIPAVRSRPTLTSIFEPLHEEQVGHEEQDLGKKAPRRHLFPALRVVVDANDAEAGSQMKLLSQPQKVIQAAVADRIASPLSRSASLPKRESTSLPRREIGPII
jgi:hypothetical protein